MGAGGDEDGWERIKPGAKSRTLNQREPHNRATHAKRKPAKTHVSAGFAAGTEGLGHACCPGCRSQWGAPSTSRGGSRDRRGRAPPRLARPSARGMWEQPTGSGGVPVLAGSALSPKGGGLWPPALPARPQSEFFANPGGICLGCGNSW